MNTRAVIGSELLKYRYESKALLRVWKSAHKYG